MENLPVAHQISQKLKSYRNTDSHLPIAHQKLIYKLQNSFKTARNLLNCQYWTLSVHKRIIRENEAKKKHIKKLIAMTSYEKVSIRSLKHFLFTILM